MSREPDIILPTAEGAIVGRIDTIRGRDAVNRVIDELLAPPRRSVARMNTGCCQQGTCPVDDCPFSTEE